MPLPGGASDKAGNSYERRWTVWALIELLAGRAQSLRIEVPGDAGTPARSSGWSSAPRRSGIKPSASGLAAPGR
jgi:hypothetical protein